MLQALSDLYGGFGVALEPANLLWSFVGVLLGNLIGVLPGMGALPAMSILLPLTFTMHAVPAILMLAGIFYGSQYGGAIGAILLNMPSHPPHAITCLDGYPMTRQGRGGVALGITMIASLFAASFGILVMIFASPLLVRIAFRFQAPEIFSIMLLGLVAGGTMARGSPLKGMAMTVLGLLLGSVGTDLNTGVERFTFGLPQLQDRVDLAALALGLFGVAEFMRGANQPPLAAPTARVRLRDMRPSWADIRLSAMPILRGTLVGTFFGAMPGTGPTISTFVAYAVERRLSRTPARFGRGALEGVAAPEAASHSKTQVDFIPTMTLGIPGDAVMALILGALLIQGITPGPQLISEHADLFWGLVASFWVGNFLLVVLNVPLIGVWVRLLRIPYHFMYPCGLFFVAVGVYSTSNDLFEVWEVLFFGLGGLLLQAFDFPIAVILLGYVLGPLLEENFRRTLLLSRGSLAVFVERPISAGFIAAALLLVLLQVGLGMRAARLKRRSS